MAQATLSIRVSSEDKSRFEEFCNQTGLNISTCINMFIKAVLREQRLPFEVKTEHCHGEKTQNEPRNQLEDDSNNRD